MAEKDRPAYVRRDAVSSGGTVKGNAFESLWQVTPPTIALKYPGEATTAKTVPIEGVVTDETSVLDVFIFVRNR